MEGRVICAFSYRLLERQREPRRERKGRDVDGEFDKADKDGTGGGVGGLEMDG